MYDFDLHMRFVKSATEAWFQYASAGMAAFGAWQDDLEAKAAPQPVPSVPNPFAWWMSAFTPSQSPATPSLPDFGAAFFQFAPSPFASAGSPFTGAFSPQNSMQAMTWVRNWTDMMQACAWAMPKVSWSMYQMPMTAWLMSSGLPYAVAAPTARANAASMDAAEAAREGLNRVFSSFRTDGGHSFSPAISFASKLMLLFFAPWAAALSFFSGGNPFA